MTLDDRLENVAVIGAAGKMGSGIALLLAQEMAKLKIRNPDKVYRLIAVDISEKALDGLKDYLYVQARKAAEKGCAVLRELYKERSDLIENYDIIDQFTRDIMNVLCPTTEISLVKNAHMIFEAIVEDEKIKIKILKQLKDLCSDTTFYFTNTSSIPIHALDEGVGLKGHIIGYHFYNPPAVQKLAELITAKTTKKALIDLSHEIGNRLRKKIIPSNDIAGFIGNGHFMRDILHAIDEVKKLSESFTLQEGIYAINRISQDFLIRPMGIFQLIDYVGIDVCQLIMKVMSTHIPGVKLSSKLINQMVEKKIVGGQYADGGQKDGFLKYEKNRPVGIFDIASNQYIMFDHESWTKRVDEKLGPMPERWAPWRSYLLDQNKDENLKIYFDQLKKMNTIGSKIAVNYMKRSKEIGIGLIDDGVANTAEDVNGVLVNGFYHLYGPINEYIE